MKPHPPGIDCVVVWSLTGRGLCSVVTAGANVLHGRFYCPETDDIHGPYHAQEIVWPDGVRSFHPIAWLRPLEDPDGGASCASVRKSAAKCLVAC